MNKEQSSKEHTIKDSFTWMYKRKNTLFPYYADEPSCELVRGDQFKDVDKNRGKIIVVCVY